MVDAMAHPIVRMLRGLVVLAGLAIIGLLLFVLVGSQRRLARKYDVAATRVVVRTDSAAVEHGRYLFQSITCSLCHAVDGGGAVIDDSPMIGVIAGPNLTRGHGGVAAVRSDTDLVRAIRRGVRRDGTSLLIMPSEVFTHLSEEDLASILGYVRQLPPVDREVPKSHFGPMGRALLAFGKLNVLVAPKTPRYVAPEVSPPRGTVEYGRYLADVSGCHGCHGYGLSGGRVAGPPGLPPASNLTPTGIGDWTEADFFRAMREGKRKDGSTLDQFMPWRIYGNMTDEDLRALWSYLRTVPPKAFGNK